MTAAFAALQYFRGLFLSDMNLGRSEGLVQEMELGEVNADAFRVPTYISVRLKLCRTRDIAGNRRFFAVYRYLYKAADLPESGEGGTGAGEARNAENGASHRHQNDTIIMIKQV